MFAMNRMNLMKTVSKTATIYAATRFRPSESMAIEDEETLRFLLLTLDCSLSLESHYDDTFCLSLLVSANFGREPMLFIYRSRNELHLVDAGGDTVRKLGIFPTLHELQLGLRQVLTAMPDDGCPLPHATQLLCRTQEQPLVSQANSAK